MQKSIIIGLVILLITGIALIQLLRARTNSGQLEPDFGQFVKNPDLWRALVDADEESEMATEEAAS